METRANHVLIGAFVLLALAAGLGFVFWMQGYGGPGGQRGYSVLFEGSVRGLSASSGVLFNGLRAGRVERIAIDTEDSRRVRVVVFLDPAIPVRRNSRASIAQFGLAGAPALMISPGTPDSPVVGGAGDEPYPLIPADAVASGGSLLETAPRVLETANLALTRIDSLVSDNQESIRNAVRGFEAFAGTLEANKDDVAAIIKNVRGLSEDFAEIRASIDKIGSAFDKVSGLVDRNAKDFDASIHNIAEVTGALAAKKDDIAGVVDKANQAFARLNEVIDKNARGIETTVAAMEAVASTLSARKDDIDIAIKGAASITTSIAERKDDIDRAIRGVADVAGTLAERKDQIAGTIDKADQSFAKINSLLETNAGGIEATVRNLSELTAALNDRKDDIGAIITNAREISEEFKGVSVKLEKTLDDVSGFTGASGETQSLMTDVRQAAQSFKQVAGELNRTLTADDGLAKRAERSLKEIELFMRDGRRTASTLDRVLDNLDRNPQSLLFGGRKVPEYTPSQ